MKYIILLLTCLPLFAIDSDGDFDLNIYLTPLDADKVQIVKIDKHLKITYHNLKRNISVCETALKVVHTSNMRKHKREMEAYEERNNKLFKGYKTKIEKFIGTCKLGESFATHGGDGSLVCPNWGK